jgi:hypothetical protein
LLAYHRGEWLDPVALQRLEGEMNESRRLKAHLESIRHLDLARAAAIQDGADLERFDLSKATDLCMQVAVERGAVFEQSAGNPKSMETVRMEWPRHTNNCVFCRRMRVQAITRCRAREDGIPAGEPLLVDWLLSHYYEKALATVAEALVLLSKLPRDLRNVFVRHFFQKVPLEQLAAELKVPVEEVEGQIAAAKRRMQEARKGM